MRSDDSAIKPLRDYLEKLSAGTALDVKQVADLLSSCRASLEGSNATKMRGDKLWRIEEPEWNPPFLDFSIERHGQTVMGSSRASLYRWRVNVREGSATIVGEKRRQLHTMDKRLDVRPIAEAVADAIINTKDDARISIGKNGTIKLKIANIIPATKSQTTSSRRSRFRKYLNEMIAPHGWKELRANIYYQPK